jgi:branched-chain amino acid transport system permease protein
MPARRYALAAAGSILLVGIVVAGGLLWASGGGGARQILISQLLVNIILVVGLQIFIGNSGILSFGHLGFAAITGYTVAVLAMPAERKLQVIPNAPWGVAAVELHPLLATLAGIGIALLVGLVVGTALCRVSSIAATMITLALLFVTHAVAVNWITLTDGGGGLSHIPRLADRGWIYGTLVVAVVGARWFQLTRAGRWSKAGREDRLAVAASGVTVRVWWLVAFMLSVLVVAVAAALRVQMLGSITPSFFFFDLTLLTLTMLIVGGLRSVTGAVSGVVVITIGNELTRYLAGDGSVAALSWILRPGLSNLFLGGAMVGFMLLRPDGLLGDWELDEWLERRLLRTPRAAPTVLPAVPPNGDPPVTLAARGITVEFGGFRALDDVSIEIRSDEVVGLIGPNGAGKTTLLNVITGVVTPGQGSVSLGNTELTGASPAAIARAGVARTFQNLRLFGGLPAAENVAVAAMAAARYRPGQQGPDVEALLADAGLWTRRDRPAATLDYGAQRKLELARAAALLPAFLLLDEPTAGMSDSESAAMVRHVRDTARRAGAGVMVIDHDLHFITNICDRIYVLDYGRLIAMGTPDEIRANPAVIEAYLGTGGAGTQPTDAVASGT